MFEAFRLGGFGMWPTLVFGVLLIGASLRYAIKPEARFVPLQITLSLLTLFAGALGFVTGLITSFTHLGEMPPDGNKWIPLIGAGESLVNLALALGLVILAVIAASIGAVKIARGEPVGAKA